MAAMLEVKNLDVYYEAIHAIHGISFEVNQGEIVTLIGANGAGKTTVLHAVSGLISASGGSVNFCGTDLLKMNHYDIVRLGLAQVPEGRRIFANMSVLENLQMGAYSRKDSHIDKELNKIFERLPRLKERKHQLAGTLSGGEQQMLAIGRALMSNPKMILLDEPSMGLSPILVQEIFSIIKDVNKSGMTVLLVEQNAKMALKIANRAYVLETGEIVMGADAAALAKNELVKSAYLGG